MHGGRRLLRDAELDFHAWTREAFAATVALPDVRRAGLGVVEGGGRRLRFTASDRPRGADAEWCHVDAYDDLPLNTAVRTGKPVRGSLDELEQRYPAFVGNQRGTGTVAAAAVPMVAAGQVVGGFVLFYHGGQAFEPEQRLQLVEMGVELGEALRRVQRDQLRRPVALAEEPVPPGAHMAVQEVAPDPVAVAGARRFLRRTLRDWGVDDETTDAAVLCLSELATNALMHTHAGCTVRLLLESGVLTTTVRDGGAALGSALDELDDPLRVHGRGLQVVEALASRWGSEVDAVGTTVWFVLEP